MQRPSSSPKRGRFRTLIASILPLLGTAALAGSVTTAEARWSPDCEEMPMRGNVDGTMMWRCPDGTYYRHVSGHGRVETDAMGRALEVSDTATPGAPATTPATGSTGEVPPDPAQPHFQEVPEAGQAPGGTGEPHFQHAPQ